MRVVVASHNEAKRRELQALLDPLSRSLELLSPGSLGLAEPAEPYGTFIENALHKARQASAATGLPALADDSGLTVAALGGAPGVESATFAGPVPTRPGEPREALRKRQDAANNARLLELLGPQTAQGAPGGPGAGRQARFVCTLVAIRSAQDPEPLVAQGRWEGEILLQPRGRGGFGYDPLMWIAQLQACVAELDAETKNRLSHRGIAAALLRAQIREAWGLALDRA